MVNSSQEGQRAVDVSLETAVERARDIARILADCSLEGQKAVEESLERAASRAQDIAQVMVESSLEGQKAVDVSLETAANRAREIAQMIADSSVDGQRTVEQSLSAAAERARQIAAVIVESGSEGAERLAENFERLHSATDEQRRRTIEWLRTVYEQATGESGQMFKQASDRFQEIIAEMKQMAGEMRRELDTTRSELRRGILELPQETADTAAQMRRVIVDQIEALAELNRIVARHGRGLDTVEPSRRVQRDEPAAGAASERIDPPPRPPAARPIERPEQRAERPERPAPAPARRAEAPSLSPAGGNGRSGWLSELLNRASRELGESEPESAREPARNDDRTPRHSIESLDSLSVDIARMIDHDAAAELWDRYKRGERNVFTRRLYTLQGQQAFDEIRRKYRLDREFKQTVDRYVEEFERLLDEVSHDDRGQVVARTYLTSETGKVYTMLAHAAGRFD